MVPRWMACQGSNTEIGVESHLHASDNCLPKAFAHPPVTSHVLMAVPAAVSSGAFAVRLLLPI